MLLLNFIGIVGLAAIAMQAHGLNQSQMQQSVNPPTTVTETDADVITSKPDSAVLPEARMPQRHIIEPLPVDAGAFKGAGDNKQVVHDKVNFESESRTEKYLSISSTAPTAIEHTTEADKQYELKELLAKLPFIEKLEKMVADSKEFGIPTPTPPSPRPPCARLNTHYTDSVQLMQICKQLRSDELYEILDDRRPRPPMPTDSPRLRKHPYSDRYMF